MPADPTESNPEPSSSGFSLEDALADAMKLHPDGDVESLPVAPAIERPDETNSALVPDVIKPEARDDAPKPGSYKALKLEKDREREEALAALRAEYETKLAEAAGKAVDVASINKGWEDRLAAAEALKAKHEARTAELEKRVIDDYETPYSIEVDPEAAPVLSKFSKATDVLNAAVNGAATSLGEDARSVDLIASNRALFGTLIQEMATGMTPDAVHAQSLVTGLAKIGVTVYSDDARAVIRDLKGAVPYLREAAEAQGLLQTIRAKNEPNWTGDQSARHEAYRRAIARAADVPDENAAEGDDAVIAGILKGKPELRQQLQAESDRLSSLVVGPKPGRATADAIRATPRSLHETAVKAARLPVIVAAYRESEADRAALQARIAELEARVASDNGAVPKPANTGAAPVKGKFDLNQELERIYGKP